MSVKLAGNTTNTDVEVDNVSKAMRTTQYTSAGAEIAAPLLPAALGPAGGLKVESVSTTPLAVTGGNIFDQYTDFSAYVSPQHELKTSSIIRLVGPNFVGTTIDTQFWGTTLVGTGTVTQAPGACTFATGATANSAATLTSVRKGRFLFGCVNQFRAAIKLPNTGATDNTKRWGAFDATEGLGFVNSGTTFGIFTRKGGADTTVLAGAFNGPGGTGFVLDTNVHFYEVVYYVARADFYIDGQLYHSITPTTAAICNDFTNPITISNVNANGSVTPVSFECWNVSIFRLSSVEPRHQFCRISSNTTSVCKRGAGTLHHVSINTPGTGGNTMTIYDNTAASGTVIAIIATASAAAMAQAEFDIDFSIGLTVVTATGAAGDYTVTVD